MERYDDTRKRQDLQKIFIKQCLLNKVFVGRYTERRLIESLCKYADVIEVDRKDQEFNSTLSKINEKLERCSDKKIVSCVSGDEVEGYSIYTDLSDVAFGSYWFMVKDVTFTGTSISISVKRLRSYEIDVEPLNAKYCAEFWNNFDYSKFLLNIVANIALVCTKENIINAFRFLSAVFLSLVAGTYELLQLLLKFVHELNNTIHICVPVMIAAIDGLTKVFGGLLILFHSLFRGGSPQKISNFNLEGKPKYIMDSNRNPYTRPAFTRGGTNGYDYRR